MRPSSTDPVRANSLTKPVIPSITANIRVIGRASFPSKRSIPVARLLTGAKNLPIAAKKPPTPLVIFANNFPTGANILPMLTNQSFILTIVCTNAFGACMKRPVVKLRHTPALGSNATLNWLVKLLIKPDIL